LDADDLRRHISYKRDGERSLNPVVAAHMLAALDDGATPDYQVLHQAACWPAPPAVVYHTAAVADREAILATGLHGSQPGSGDSPWADPDGVWASQPVGVYVAEGPDSVGRWSRWEAWDVWAVDVSDLTWAPDLMNPRCWLITADIAPQRLTLADTRPHARVQL